MTVKWRRTRQDVEEGRPILLCTDTSTRHFEQAIRAVIPTDLHRYASIAAYCVTFFAEVKFV